MKIRFLFCILFLFQFLCVFSQNTRSTISYTEAPFFHGVASGDPLPNQVMIWTKVTPPSGSNVDIDVFWQIATDTAFQNVVNFGKIVTDENKDFTVKIDVCGLLPNTHYYYVFKSLGSNSIIGRTKTAPIGNNSSARYAVASCSNYEHGFFNAYESMANRNDLDAVIHLGDYYYEYESGGFSSTVITDDFGRTVEPTNEAISLDDYRARHSHYKLDNQLQMVHQMYPFITTWDDHETANDSYKDGAQNHDTATEGPWADRKVSSFQAYEEWMPMRTDTASNGKVWRKLRYGNLLDLIIIDTRIWGRDIQDIALTDDTSHHLLGADQFAWLENELSDTTTQWKIICNQMMVAPLEIFGIPVNADQWDGYNSERDRLINYIETNNIKNTVVLTGDIHTSWVNNVPGNVTTNAATEFVVTSVTSPGLDVIEVALGQLPNWILNIFSGSIPNVIKSLNPHMEYVNINDHGYMVFTVDSSKAQGDYVYLEREDTIFSDDFGASYFTPNNVSAVQEASTHLPINIGAFKPPLAPVQNLDFAILMDTMYFMTTENLPLNECLVNANSYCPGVTTTVLQNATYGNAVATDYCFQFQSITNYFGQESFTLEICKDVAPFSCDTVLVIVDIEGVNDVEENTYSIMNDSLLQDCLSFNDLTTSIDSLFFSGGNSGNFVLDSTACFVFEPDTNFCGIDEIIVIACDDNSICDTVILNFIIDGLLTTQIVNLYGTSQELLNHCITYDDITGNIISTNLVYDGISGNALIYNDTCLSYQSNAMLTNGIDTLRTIACNDLIPQKCDTIIYYINIETDEKPDTTIIVIDGITEIENNQFAILGIYPNPFDIEIIIQYYQFTKENISLKLFDVSGRLIYNETIKDNSIGLKYAKLNTKQMSRGNYILEINNGNFSYTKKLLK